MPKSFYLFLLSVLFSSCTKNEVVNPAPPHASTYTPIELKRSSFTIGNLEKGIQDTFLLQFNKSIEVDYIELLSSTCLPRLEDTVVNHGTTVKFYKLLCGELGKDFSFEFSVRDQEGKHLVDTVTYSYYTRKLPVEGQVINYTITPDNKYCWVSTNTPDRIYCFGLTDTTYKKVYNVEFKPAKIVINPYNQKLYILTYAHYQPTTDRIYVMNPDDGHIDKVITIKKDQYDDPQKKINLYDLDFGYNGYGVLITGTTQGGKSRWRILDSRFNDSISVHPEWIAATGINGNYNFDEFTSCQANHNKTKLYLRKRYSLPRAGVLDCTSKNVVELTYCSTNPNHYIVPNKTSDKLFIASYAYQSILESSGCGTFSEFDNRYSEGADFSYRNNEENVMYYMSRSYGYEFLILDYKNAKILMKANVSPYFKKITSTTDGKFMLALTGNLLHVYHIDMFYKNL